MPSIALGSCDHMFANQSTAAKPRQKYTIGQVAEASTSMIEFDMTVVVVEVEWSGDE